MTYFVPTAIWKNTIIDDSSIGVMIGFFLTVLIGIGVAGTVSEFASSVRTVVRCNTFSAERESMI